MTICAVCQSGSSVSFGIAFPHLYYPLSYALPEARTPAGLYFSVSAAPFPLLHKYLLSWIECKNTSKKKKRSWKGQVENEIQTHALLTILTGLVI